jgi:hypothetical protein
MYSICIYLGTRNDWEMAIDLIQKMVADPKMMKDLRQIFLPILNGLLGIFSFFYLLTKIVLKLTLCYITDYSGCVERR